MTEPVSAIKLLLLSLAAVTVAPAAADQAQHIERMILGARQSVFLVALAGSFIGAGILPGHVIAQLMPDAGAGVARCAGQLCIRFVGFAFGVVGYALAAAWLVDLLPLMWSKLTGAPQLPLAGMLGIAVRPLLPRYLEFLGTRAPMPGRDQGDAP
ncbi:hypothetical protein [Stenotrophomonas sp. MMGLT7]|uniref:hypothetical protein n=1 Tax=Stenotrophomonas sp. MMGLT7 TaxID=2901227 RepID=UPI001E580217|nr:hypothetical protein [Stenotrophomonas sp. MMGLT7]MCD7096921.1 hypothetical protein [Stenotrophomonas sp. MMGLT7]